MQARPRLRGWRSRWRRDRLLQLLALLLLQLHLGGQIFLLQSAFLGLVGLNLRLTAGRAGLGRRPQLLLKLERLLLLGLQLLLLQGLRGGRLPRNIGLAARGRRESHGEDEGEQDGAHDPKIVVPAPFGSTLANENPATWAAPAHRADGGGVRRAGA